MLVTNVTNHSMSVMSSCIDICAIICNMESTYVKLCVDIFSKITYGVTYVQDICMFWHIWNVMLYGFDICKMYMLNWNNICLQCLNYQNILQHMSKRFSLCFAIWWYRKQYLHMRIHMLTYFNTYVNNQQILQHMSERFSLCFAIWW